VIEGDDVDRASAHTSRPTPAVTDKNRMPAAAKVGIGLGFAVVLIPILVVVSMANSFYQNAGGHAYTATDSTVTAARMTADGNERGDVEVIVANVQPLLGQPTMRAVLDRCVGTYDAEMLNNDITCTRSYFLYYPLPGDSAADRNVSVALSTAMSHMSEPNLCAPQTIGSNSCTPPSGSVTMDRVTSPTDKDEFFSYKGDAVETGGFPELTSAAAQGHCLVVQLSVGYFSD
jgi:hypothetical protein